MLIVGAGLSGIGAAYHLKTRCPDRTWEIVEARDAIGGTWDLFRYPGVRSDSDMHTLGYSFKPWRSPESIADGSSILSYVRETAAEHGIDAKIRFGKRMVRADWASADALWTVTLLDVATGTTSAVSCRLLYLCTGYYEYEAGYTPDFPGRDAFEGRIVHPQKWTPDVSYDGKRVVVIGSGATAMTLVPELAKKAAHVTMLQRSPTYVVSAPRRDKWARWAPPQLLRWRNIVLGMAFYYFCRRFPALAKKKILGWTRRQLAPNVELERHFTPRYAPWDQRLCLVPDADLFRAIRAGRASVVTDRIESFTARGLRLASGAELAADLVVTATGLVMRMVGGAAIAVDGAPVDVSQTLVYRGAMGSDLPNLALAVGYTNASWTLKCDLTAAYVCRLLNHMRQHGYTTAVPRPRGGAGAVPLVDFSSGYVQRALDKLPKQGERAPWKLYQNYVLDLLTLRYGRVAPEVDFSRSP